MERTRELHLDMDGTLVDLYRNQDWRIDVAQKTTTCFEEAEAFLPREGLRAYLRDLRRTDRCEVVINTWAPQGADREYIDRVAFAKLVWLAENVGLDMIDRFVCLPYGTPKVLAVSAGATAVLIDDNEEQRRVFLAARHAAVDEATLWKLVREFDV